MHEREHGTYASVTEWEQFLAENPDIRSIDAFVIDSNGNLQGKRLEVEDGPGLFHGGVLFSASSLVADVRGYGIEGHGFGSTDGDPDGAAKPLPRTLVRTPWTRKPSAQVLCEMTSVQTGRPYWYDPRLVLSDVVRQCRAAGIHPVVACELEFYLVDPKRNKDGSLRLGAHAGRSPPRRGANLSMEAVDDFGEGVGGFVVFEFADFGEGGREAGEIEVGAADEVAAGGGFVRGDLFGFEFVVDESVDRAGVFGDGLEGPEFALFGGDDVFTFAGLGGFDFGPEGAVFDPGGEDGDFRVGHAGCAEGHLHLVVGVGDGLDEEALFGLAGHDGGAGFAAFEEGVAGVDGEAAQGGGGVATVAAVGEDGSDFEFEIFGGRVRRGEQRNRAEKEG